MCYRSGLLILLKPCSLPHTMHDKIPTETISFHSLTEKLVGMVASIPFALQIGAMDGIKFDLLHQHLIKGAWSGLLVEPVPDMFEKLRETYKTCSRLHFANCAISDSDGFLTLRRVDPIAIGKGLIPEEALGITSSFIDRSLFSHPKFAQAYPEVAQDYISEIRVPCCTLRHLLEKHDVQTLDLVMIDTEGADWLIARQLDLKQFTPSLICLEYTSLPSQEIEDCSTHFVSHGYKVALCLEDQQNLVFYKNTLC